MPVAIPGTSHMSPLMIRKLYEVDTVVVLPFYR